MNNNDKYFMMEAISEAEKSNEPLKCGVVIAKNGKIIAKTFNSQRADNNATSHAEIKALAVAGKYLGTKNLDNCIAYCTCEPCIMCLTAMTFAKLKQLIYGVSLKDVSDKLIQISSNELILKSPNKIELIKNFMEKECRNQLYSGKI